MDKRKLEFKWRTKEFAGRIVRLYVALPLLWLELLRDDCGISLPEISALWAEADELIAIFVTMARRTKEKPET